MIKTSGQLSCLFSNNDLSYRHLNFKTLLGA
uniref:Uncharacterized protein n=1 Tax=Rhizophora mucronata TaxID=61149 RepID=A0A2P2NL71_RHIMU